MKKNSTDRQVCTDPIVGSILSGWRFDISNISPEMRTEYEFHLEECGHCRRRQHLARSKDVLALSITLLFCAFCALAAVVLHRFEILTHIPGTFTLHVRQTAVFISLEAIAIAGLVLSTVLSVLVAITTPVPSLISTVVRNRISPDLRERLARRHAA